jgi:hypothetical protein
VATTALAPLNEVCWLKGSVNFTLRRLHVAYVGSNQEIGLDFSGDPTSLARRGRVATMLQNRMPHQTLSPLIARR